MRRASPIDHARFGAVRHHPDISCFGDFVADRIGLTRPPDAEDQRLECWVPSTPSGERSAGAPYANRTVPPLMVSISRRATVGRTAGHPHDRPSRPNLVAFASLTYGAPC